MAGCRRRCSFDGDEGVRVGVRGRGGAVVAARERERVGG
jgi:hypothetical protein